MGGPMLLDQRIPQGHGYPLTDYLLYVPSMTAMFLKTTSFTLSPRMLNAF